MTRALLLSTLLFAGTTGMTQDQIGSDINGAGALDQSGIAVSISNDGTRIAIGASLLNSGISAGNVRVFQQNGGNWTQLGGNINGEAAGDFSGNAVSLSGSGNRVAIGSKLNSENGNEDAGHARVFQYNGSSWTQLGTDMNGEGPGDQLGTSISISDDGSRVAVGAPFNQDGGGAGHVRVYNYNGSNWVQLGADIAGEAQGDQAGKSVSISGDGMRVAVGMPMNDGNGNNSGQVRVYQYNGSTWNQIGADLNGEAATDEFGFAVALNFDGSRLAVGAIRNDGSGADAGHVRVFQYNGSSWAQLGADIDGEAANDFSGHSVSLTHDGARVAIGARGNNLFRGHVRVYDLNAAQWTQVGVDMDGEGESDNFGFSSFISADGERVVIGGPYNDDNGIDAGHTRVFGGLPLALTEGVADPVISIGMSLTNGLVTVSFEEVHPAVQVAVINATGQVVANHAFANTDRLVVPIDGSAGLYFIELITGSDQRTVVKVVKE